MSLLLLVRHGQSIYNAQNRFTGTLDIALSEKGKLEARLKGIKLKMYQFDCACTSVLSRAICTLEIILEVVQQKNVPVVKNSALNERMYGSLQGLNKTETIQKYGAEQVALWRRSFAVAPPEGESLAATYERVIPFYRKTIEPKLEEGKTILVVAHGNSLRALMMYLENFTPEVIASVNISTCVPRVYELDNNLKIKSVHNIC